MMGIGFFLRASPIAILYQRSCQWLVVDVPTVPLLRHFHVLCLEGRKYQKPTLAAITIIVEPVKIIIALYLEAP
jgi:hypothetical protein